MPKGKPKLKTAIMTLRVEPKIKAMAETAAKNDRRSVTSFIELLVLAHGEKYGINPPSSDNQEGKE